MFKYFFLTLKHKWFVYSIGRRLGVSRFRLLMHDWSKLLPWNLRAYGRQFFGKADRPEEFIHCWIRHQNTHEHHWEYWIPRTGHNRCTPPYPDNTPICMPEYAVREMVADWMGAGRAYEGKWPDPNNWTWFDTAKDKMVMHPDTWKTVYIVIMELRCEERKKDGN